MMSAAQQHKSLGLSAQAVEDMVVIQVGSQMTFLTPQDMRTFLKWAAAAMFRAEIVELDRQLAKQKER